MSKVIICEHMGGFIGEILDQIIPANADAALFRGWDSQRDARRIVESLTSLGVEAVHTSFGALVDLQAVSLLQLADSMSGFDEVWIGGHNVAWGALVAVPPLTSDVVVLGHNDCGPYMAGLRSSSALMGLGDGLGINVVRYSTE